MSEFVCLIDTLCAERQSTWCGELVDSSEHTTEPELVTCPECLGVLDVRDGAVVAHGLTRRQHQVMLAIQDHVARRGFAPTLRELSATMGWRSIHSATEMIGKLTRKGYLLRTPGLSRAIQVLRPVGPLPPARRDW